MDENQASIYVRGPGREATNWLRMRFNVDEIGLD